MAVYVNGQKMAKPLLGGVPYNALYNGRKLWGTPADTVTGVVILAPDGGKPATSLPVGGTVELAAKATYADGHTSDLLTAEHVFFHSLDETVAVTDGNRVVWRHGGTAVIRARVGGFDSPAISINAAYAPESITVTDENGLPVDKIVTRVGEETYLKIHVLPAAAAQDFTASSADPKVATVGAPSPRSITVNPESLTMRVGETARLTVSVGPEGAAQEFTATVGDPKIATITK